MKLLLAALIQVEFMPVKRGVLRSRIRTLWSTAVVSIRWNFYFLGQWFSK